MKSRHLLTLDQFFSGAETLRRHFDVQFARPRHGHPGRFVWDYWHIPEQYTLLRTPAFHYFPRSIYKRWHLHMVEWGRQHLGCHDVSPPWLSIYVEGCGQEMHSDSPHGPWAFVYSLTRWQQRRFSGGETFLLKPWVTDYWRHFKQQSGLERTDLLDLVPAKFNRLTVFDPRLPHGVRTVQGEKDPRWGRVVLHGWFIEPRPFFTGGLSRAQLTGFLRDHLGALASQFKGGERVVGFISFRLRVARGGDVTQAKPLISSLRGNPDLQRHVIRTSLKSLRGWRFPRTSSMSEVTLPLTFDL